MTTRSFDTIPGVQSQHFYGTYLYGVLTDTRLTTLKNAFWHYLQTFRNHIRPDFLSSCIFFLLFLCQKVLTFSANLRNYIRLQQECISTEQPRVICAKKHKLKKVGIFFCKPDKSHSSSPLTHLSVHYAQHHMLEEESRKNAMAKCFCWKMQHIGFS